MAKTWLPTKTDPRSRVDALAARRVLRDCYRSSGELSKAEDGASWRMRWLTTVTLLRVVGHVLDKIDSKRSPFIKQSIKNAWKRWHDNKINNFIFFNFIDQERNFILKEYNIDRILVYPLMENKAHSISHPMLFGTRIVGQFELVNESIKWWEEELSLIEKEASDLLNTHREISPKIKKKRRGRTKGNTSLCKI